MTRPGCAPTTSQDWGYLWRPERYPVAPGNIANRLAEDAHGRDKARPRFFSAARLAAEGSLRRRARHLTGPGLPRRHPGLGLRQPEHRAPSPGRDRPPATADPAAA